MRLIILIMLIVLLTFSIPTTGQASIHVSGEKAVLLEQSSGRVLFEKNAHEKSKIASITKIMTAIIAIESGKMDEIAVTSKRAIYTEGSSIYLEQGEKMSIEDLVYGLMLRSGNDAAVTIGEHIGGSVEGFVHLMNEKARWLGMTDTYFDNPHGLDSDAHYSTAYDMALLLRYAMENKTYEKISSTTNYKAKERTYAWRNKNKLLSFYDYCTGGKTGYTKISGRTLATTASKNEMNLIAVTLNAPDDWRDHMNMYEWGFNNYQLEPLEEKGEHHYQLKETSERQTGYINDEVYYPLTETEKQAIEKKTFLLPTINEQNLNEQIGKSVYYLDADPVVEIPIFESSVQSNESFLTDVMNYFKSIVGFD